MKKLSIKFNLNWYTILIFIGIIAVLIVIDQLTKYWAFKNLPMDKEIDCMKPLFKFSLLTNDGGMFNFLAGHFTLFYIFTVIGLLLFFFMLNFADFIKYPFYTIGLLMTIAGTIGNCIDRIRFSYVRDFLTFGFFNFASFNFADMCMTCGIICLAIDIVFTDVGGIWK